MRSVSRVLVFSLTVFLLGTRATFAAADSGPVAPGIAITYTLAQPGQVSLGVYDSLGHQVRTLLTGEKRPAGQYTVTWDGLNRYGQAQPAGQYEWRLLRTPGFSREFLVNVGIQTPWAPYGVWPGNHFGPSLVRMDQDGSLYVGSLSSEGPPHLLKMSLDGARNIGTRERGD